MAYILNIETATTNCSVSLSYKGETLVLKEDNSKNYSHAERLHVYIDTVLNEADISKQQLDAVAVSKGPGSYTGLRIGVSAAKGLCFALDVPLIAISTLQSLALQSNTTEGLVIPLLDARRMEVYSAIFDNNNQCLREVQAQIIEPSSFSEFLEKGKSGFGSPTGDWLRQSLRQELESYIEPDMLKEQGIFNVAEVASIEKIVGQ